LPLLEFWASEPCESQGSRSTASPPRETQRKRPNWGPSGAPMELGVTVCLTVPAPCRDHRHLVCVESGMDEGSGFWLIWGKSLGNALSSPQPLAPSWLPTALPGLGLERRENHRPRNRMRSKPGNKPPASNSQPGTRRRAWQTRVGRVGGARPHGVSAPSQAPPQAVGSRVEGGGASVAVWKCSAFFIVRRARD